MDESSIVQSNAGQVSHSLLITSEESTYNDDETTIELSSIVPSDDNVVINQIHVHS